MLTLKDAIYPGTKTNSRLFSKRYCLAIHQWLNKRPLILRKHQLLDNITCFVEHEHATFQAKVCGQFAGKSSSADWTGEEWHWHNLTSAQATLLSEKPVPVFSSATLPKACQWRVQTLLQSHCPWPWCEGWSSTIQGH